MDTAEKTVVRSKGWRVEKDVEQSPQDESHKKKIEQRCASANKHGSKRAIRIEKELASISSALDKQEADEAAFSPEQDDRNQVLYNRAGLRPTAHGKAMKEGISIRSRRFNRLQELSEFRSSHHETSTSGDREQSDFDLGNKQVPTYACESYMQNSLRNLVPETPSSPTSSIAVRSAKNQNSAKIVLWDEKRNGHENPGEQESESVPSDGTSVSSDSSFPSSSSSSSCSVREAMTMQSSGHAEHSSCLYDDAPFLSQVQRAKVTESLRPSLVRGYSFEEMEPEKPPRMHCFDPCSVRPQLMRGTSFDSADEASILEDGPSTGKNDSVCKHGAPRVSSLQPLGVRGASLKTRNSATRERRASRRPVTKSKQVFSVKELNNSEEEEEEEDDSFRDCSAHGTLLIKPRTFRRHSQQPSSPSSTKKEEFTRKESSCTFRSPRLSCMRPTSPEGRSFESEDGVSAGNTNTRVILRWPTLQNIRVDSPCTDQKEARRDLLRPTFQYLFTPTSAGQSEAKCILRRPTLKSCFEPEQQCSPSHASSRRRKSEKCEVHRELSRTPKTGGSKKKKIPVETKAAIVSGDEPARIARNSTSQSDGSHTPTKDNRSSTIENVHDLKQVAMSLVDASTAPPSQSWRRKSSWVPPSPPPPPLTPCRDNASSFSAPPDSNAATVGGTPLWVTTQLKATGQKEKIESNDGNLAKPITFPVKESSTSPLYNRSGLRSTPHGIAMKRGLELRSRRSRRMQELAESLQKVSLETTSDKLTSLQCQATNNKNDAS